MPIDIEHKKRKWLDQSVEDVGRGLVNVANQISRLILIKALGADEMRQEAKVFFEAFLRFHDHMAEHGGSTDQEAVQTALKEMMDQKPSMFPGHREVYPDCLKVGFRKEPSPDGEDATKFIPADQQEAWRERIKQLENEEE